MNTEELKNFSRKILREFWGYDSFRPLQEDIVVSVLEGHDTLALLPTGGGKSVCFQVPALAKEGICIVVSPLIALMKDQVEQLRKRNILAAAIYSGLNKREIDIVLDNCIYGGYKFLYVSPERLKTEVFLERVKKMKVSLIAVDEAHCISQWGYDFRPPYLEIAALRDILPEVNVIALTATATKEVKADIQDKLRFRNPKVFQKSFIRSNLSYSVFNVEDKDKKLLEIFTKVKGTGIVYVRNRKKTKEIASFLKKHGISAGCYHAGLDHKERALMQDQWINNRIRVMVATNAFGMGIDKPDVRAVVHAGLVDSLEAYYQEAGRGGRDEKKAYAVLLYHNSDITDLKNQVLQSYPELDFIKKVYQCLANYFKIAVGSSYMSSYAFDLNEFSQSFKLPPLEAFNALKNLQDEGLIQLNETFYNPSRLMSLLNHQDLYKFQVANASFDPTIKVLLRIYGGEIFSNFLPISEAQIAKYLGDVDVADVESSLQMLHQREVFVYDAKKDKPQITFLTPRYDAASLPLNKERLEERKKSALKKVEAVAGYVTHENRCRQLILLEYFDEISYANCGICDFCLNRQKSSIPDEEKIRAGIKLIKDVLFSGPLQVEELIEEVKPKNKENFLKIIKLMIDQQLLKYDEFGRLVVL